MAVHMPIPEEAIANDLESFHAALMSAYPQLPVLDRMLKFRMKINRAADVVVDGPLQDVILAVLQHVEATGSLALLLRNAYEFNPGNPKLKQYASRFLDTPDVEDAGREAPDGNPAPVVVRRPLVVGMRFLRQNLQRAAAAVCRIENDDLPLATGFLMDADLVLTCEYVLGSRTDVPAATRFRFFDHHNDGPPQGRVVAPAASWKVASSRFEDLDYTLIRLAEPVGKDLLADGRRRGWLSLAESRAAEPESIIQLHFADGRDLKASFVSTVVVDSPSRLTYEHATSPGSGGAPCLSDDLTVVALHEAASRDRIRGQGIHAGDIRQDLARQGISLAEPPGD